MSIYGVYSKLSNSNGTCALFSHMDTLVKELFNVADKYELPQLFAMCKNQLKSEMKVTNVMELLILADMHQVCLGLQ